MRYRVDTRAGWVSYDVADADKAFELYQSEGFRLSLCDDLHDERGTVIDGLPHGVRFGAEA